MILSICLYFTLAACGLAIGLIVRQYDLCDREPHLLVLATLGLGGASMWLASQLQIGMIRALTAQGLMVDNLALSAIAGSTEEFAKFAVVVLLWAALPRFFKDPIDGLLYGSFAGLGAALEESVFILSKSHITGYLPPQEPVRLCGHLVMGGIAAFGLGLLTIRSRWAIPIIVACLAGAAGLHTAWDVAAFSAADYRRDGLRPEAWHSTIPIALMLMGMITYRRLAAIGARLTRSRPHVHDAPARQCQGA